LVDPDPEETFRLFSKNCNKKKYRLDEMYIVILLGPPSICKLHDKHPASRENTQLFKIRIVLNPFFLPYRLLRTRKKSRSENCRDALCNILQITVVPE
jgi:hypothetical protein